ncbi:MAG: acyl-[ACP]--phospholipid O-acyltransferase [Deltaproteobacteria bacterium]|nr:acyl-[ACP]--phospholipid O-acyltransferase [Deltaproteobacteria bacterium]
MKSREIFQGKSFTGLFISQATGAFNDNALQMIIFGIILTIMPAEMYDSYLALLGALLIAPFVLFSPLAGWFSDRYSKRKVLIIFKGTELFLLGIALAALSMKSLYSLFFLVFLMGSQSTFYSPSKYGILKEIVEEKRLGQANGIIDMGTFLAIIVGIVGGSFLFSAFSLADGYSGLGKPIIILSLISMTGLFYTLRVDHVPSSTRENFNVKDFFHNLRALKTNRTLRLTVIGICYFWFLAALFKMLLLLFATQEMGLSKVSQASLLLLYLCAGISAGSLVAAKLSRYRVELGLIPAGSIGMGLTCLVLPSISGNYFFVMIDIALLGFFGGLFHVPLNTLLQIESDDKNRGRFIALTNFFSNLGMLISSGALYLLSHSFQISSGNILFVLGLFSFAVSAYVFYLLPEAFFRLSLGFLTHTIYRIKTVNVDVIPEKGAVLLTPNHMSFIDGLLLQYAIPHRKVRFVVYRSFFDKPVVGWFLRMAGCIPLSEKASKDAMAEVVKSLEAGEVVCIFPEGSITRIGFMLPFRKGVELILKKAPQDTAVIPVCFDKLWGSIFSFKGGRFFRKIPERLPYPVTVLFGKAEDVHVKAFDLRQKVSELGSEAFAARGKEYRTLSAHFIRTARRFMFRSALADTNSKPLSYFKLMTASILLSKKMRRRCGEGELIGIMLPSSVAGVLTNIAAGFSGNVAVNLNFRAGDDAIAKYIEKCRMKTIITSKLFVKKAAINKLDQFVYLEDLMKEVTKGDKAGTMLAVLLLPSIVLEKLFCHSSASPEDRATVIFSSGSTGDPKGVELSHANVISNGDMVNQVLQFRPDDRMLGSLPFFHSFGYSITFWLPLLKGVFTAYVPDPLDAKKVGEMAEKYNVSVMLGTPTFYSLYTRRCSEKQFKNIRVAIAGAEKLRQSVAEAFHKKFGFSIVEGYGATEMSPVISCNAPDFNEKGIKQKGTKAGSVGLPLPGLSARVVDPEDYDRELDYNSEGMLLVKGPNLMKGYLNDKERTAGVLHDGWYVTGDIAKIDEEGFIHIVGRLSRFSKIGGEMVPHVQVEESINNILGFSEPLVVVTAVSDESKGEKLVVLHLPEATPSIDARGVMNKLKEEGFPNLWIPKEFYETPEFPILGSGKLDLKGLGNLAKELAQKGTSAKKGPKKETEK